MIFGRKDYDATIKETTNGVLIPADEPVFLIRAQDHLGAEIVKLYATRMLGNGGNPKMVAQINEHAKQMEAWGKKKIADVGEYSSYPDVEVPEVRKPKKSSPGKGTIGNS